MLVSFGHICKCYTAQPDAEKSVVYASLHNFVFLFICSGCEEPHFPQPAQIWKMPLRPRKLLSSTAVWWHWKLKSCSKSKNWQELLLFRKRYVENKYLHDEKLFSFRLTSVLLLGFQMNTLKIDACGFMYQQRIQCKVAPII